MCARVCRTAAMMVCFSRGDGAAMHVGAPRGRTDFAADPRSVSATHRTPQRQVRACRAKVLSAGRRLRLRRILTAAAGRLSWPSSSVAGLRPLRFASAVFRTGVRSGTISTTRSGADPVGTFTFGERRRELHRRICLATSPHAETNSAPNPPVGLNSLRKHQSPPHRGAWRRPRELNPGSLAPSAHPRLRRGP
jgi:hypothetical protein